MTAGLQADRSELAGQVDDALRASGGIVLSLALGVVGWVLILLLVALL